MNLWKIALALAASLVIVALAGHGFNEMSDWLRRTDDILAGLISAVLFFGTVALAWAPWFFLARER